MKKFLKDIISPISSPLLLFFVAYLYWYSRADYITGDLGKLGQIEFLDENYRNQEKFNSNYTHKAILCDANSFKENSILFIGDSFTLLTSYPESLASTLNKNACECYLKGKTCPEESYISLLNSELTLPKIVIVESVERNFISRLRSLDFSLSPTTIEADTTAPIKEKMTDYASYYKNKIFPNKAVKHLPLRDSLFSCRGHENELYYYIDDNVIPSIEDIQIALKKLDTLFQIAEQNNISMFYVIAADKYDVYQEFAINNDCAPKNVLDHFKSFEKNPYFINTKSILMPLAREGVKDLYYVDDTHWSPVGAENVANEIARRIDSLQLLN